MRTRMTWHDLVEEEERLRGKRIRFLPGGRASLDPLRSPTSFHSGQYFFSRVPSQCPLSNKEQIISLLFARYRALTPPRLPGPASFRFTVRVFQADSFLSLREPSFLSLLSFLFHFFLARSLSLPFLSRYIFWRPSKVYSSRFMFAFQHEIQDSRSYSFFYLSIIFRFSLRRYFYVVSQFQVYEKRYFSLVSYSWASQIFSRKRMISVEYRNAMSDDIGRLDRKWYCIWYWHEYRTRNKTYEIV